MPRFSISGLMTFVLVSAVGLAALRNANEVWVGIMLTLALGMLGVGLLGVFFEHTKRRAWWAGFVLFAGGYLWLAFGPWCKEEIQPKLVTTQLLAHVHSQAMSSYEKQPSVQELWTVRRNGLLAEQKYMKQLVANPNDLSLKLIQDKLNELNVLIGNTANPSGSNARFNVWPSLLTAATNYDSFVQVGHCLFSVLGGLIGAIISTRFNAARETDAARPAPP
jgi:hypothetical protein